MGFKEVRRKRKRNFSKKSTLSISIHQRRIKNRNQKRTKIGSI